MFEHRLLTESLISANFVRKFICQKFFAEAESFLLFFRNFEIELFFGEFGLEGVVRGGIYLLFSVSVLTRGGSAYTPKAENFNFFEKPKNQFLPFHQVRRVLLGNIVRFCPFSNS